MVRFDPSISYSDEASEIFSQYRKLKEEQQKSERKRLSESIAYATLKLDLLTEDMKERVETFFKENERKIEYSGEIITPEYYNQYLSKRWGKRFLSQKLINFFKLNPKQKIKVMAIYEGFAIVEAYSKAYIVPEELLEIIEQEQDTAVGNELMVKSTNQLALKNELEETKELIEKVSNFEDEAFAGQLAAIDNLKAEMEAKITAMYEMQAKMMAELQEKIKRYEHELLIMRSDLTAFEYRNGLTVDFMNIHKGLNVPTNQPIVIHQKLVYLDEDLPRLTDLYDVNSGSLEVALKNSPALLEHICPTSKGITFLKMRNSAGRFELNNTVMEFVRDVMPNEVGVLIRNGENTWLTWLDSKDISLSVDSFTSKSSDEETSLSLVQSRYFLFNLIMGLIERNEILQLDHVPTNMFADPGIIWSNADSQIADSTYVELGKIIPILNRYSKTDDPIYVLNSFTDKATYTSRYGGGTTKRGRGDNALTDNTSVKEGLNKIKGIDYFSNFTYYKKLLLINDLDNVIRKPKVYAAVSKPVLIDNEDRKERGDADYAIFAISEASRYTGTIVDETKPWREQNVHFAYDEEVLRTYYWGHDSRIKTFSSQENFDKAMAKEMVFQHLIYRKSTKECTMANIHECFGEREWHLVDFFDYEGNTQMVKEVEEMNKALKEAKKATK